MNMDKSVLKISTIVLILSIFVLGWFSNSLYNDLNGFNLEKPFYFSFFGSNNPKDVPSPYDRINKDQVHVYNDRIVIDLKGANWAEFTDTDSMDPLLDIEANSFEIKPESYEDIHVGDIVSYASEYSDGLTVHRVVETGEDKQGWYCRVKGDNLTSLDPGNIRFEQINGILVGVIY